MRLLFTDSRVWLTIIGLILHLKYTMHKCFKCGKQATRRLSPDLGGIGACEEHHEEVFRDFRVYLLGGEKIQRWFDKKYKL